MDLHGPRGLLRSHDRTSLTLLLDKGVNVEVNRELQSSTGLIVLMGFIILGLLYVSLRRVSDVAIVVVALRRCFAVDARIHRPHLESNRIPWFRHHCSLTILKSLAHSGTCAGIDDSSMLFIVTRRNVNSAKLLQNLEPSLNSSWSSNPAHLNYNHGCVFC